jgi:hypothetical protein
MWLGCAAVSIVCSSALAQTPQPFPRPGQQPAPAAPARPAAPAPAAAPATPRPPAGADPATPTEATLGFPIFTGAQFIASYDAGRGQRFYIFGAAAPFNDVVAFYRVQLKDKGNQLFQDPPTYSFEVGKFNDSTMAFPPGVTVKDFMSGGSQGYPNPRLGAQPARFPTLIQIVPAPPGTGR